MEATTAAARPAGSSYPLSALRGTAPTYAEDFALVFGDENEAVPDVCLPIDPEPQVTNGHLVWGASCTVAARAALDPDGPFYGVSAVREDERDLDDAEAVGEALEVLAEPLSVIELAALTDLTEQRVRRGIGVLERRGHVTRTLAGRWSWR